MGYIQKTVILQNGQLMWVTKVNAPMFGNHRSRVKRLKETSEAVKKTNENHAVEYVRAKIIENFSAGDPHIILTYTDENLPDSEERAKKNWKNFVARLKRRLEKNFPGKELKYITITEKGVKSRRWHHHIIPLSTT